MALSLSRRERQIMDILFRRAKATAGEIHQDLPDRPSYSAVRAHLRTLEEKGHVRHEAQDHRYVYLPTLAPSKARKGALRHMVDTFFGGSAAQAAVALLSEDAAKLSKADIDRLSAWIKQARKEEK